MFSTGWLYISPKISNCHLKPFVMALRLSLLQDMAQLGTLGFVWVYFLSGNLVVVMEAWWIKPVHVRRENDHCHLLTGNERKFMSSLSKAPHPFSHKKCIHLDDNAWKKFLIFYKGRREDAFNPLFIQWSGFGW